VYSFVSASRWSWCSVHARSYYNLYFPIWEIYVFGPPSGCPRQTLRDSVWSMLQDRSLRNLSLTRGLRLANPSELALPPWATRDCQIGLLPPQVPYGKSLRVPRVALSPRPCRSQHTVRDAPSGESSVECETGDARTVRYIFYYYCDHTTQHTLV